MRADRLLAIMLLLQARGKMTAQALAGELEVSRRTILRDIQALSMAGVPVYADGGHGGGIALDAQYRVTLTGLTEREAQALFVSGLPALLHDLGLQDQAHRTLLKLFAALPALHREAVAQFRQRIHVDPVWWWNEAAPPFWDILQAAVYEDRLLRVTYRRYDDTVLQRTLEPYSLVAKAGIWYLVARHEGEFRTYRVARLMEAEALSQMFQRQADFDLEVFWHEQTAWRAAQVEPYRFSVRVNDQGRAFLQRHTLVLDATPDGDGYYTARLRVASLEEARMLVFGLGHDGIVLEPPELREEVTRSARELLDQWREQCAAHG